MKEAKTTIVNYKESYIDYGRRCYLLAKNNNGTAGCASLFVLLMIISLIYKALPYIAVVVTVGLFIYLWVYIKKQKTIELQKKEDILKIPLEKFGDDEAEELAKKYEEHEKKNDMHHKDNDSKIPLGKFPDQEVEVLAKKYRGENVSQENGRDQSIRWKFWELKSLLDDGLIDEETYNKKKEELIKKL